MCNPMSWIELEDGKLLYLTTSDMETKRGRSLKLYLGTSFIDDICGHGAIRYFFGTENDDGTITPTERGINREDNNFNPGILPKEIVSNIKNGEFRGIFFGEQTLLSAAAWNLYEETTDPARKLYEETTAAARKLYEETTDPARKLYEETMAVAWKLYEETMAVAWKLYEETTAPARKLYEETCNKIFWDIFSDIKNRSKEWK